MALKPSTLEQVANAAGTAEDGQPEQTSAQNVSVCMDSSEGTRRRARAQHVDTLVTLDCTQKNMALGMAALDQKLALQREL